MNVNTLFKNEFVIWGKPNGSNTEQLLLSKFEGNYITSKEQAQRLCTLLETKCGCKELRVQEIDFSIEAMDDFVNTLNGSKSV